MGTFFPKGRPKAGVALSFPGVYDGIAHMDRVLWNMSVIGGYIDRTNHNNWVIVPSESGVPAGAANEFDTAAPQDVDSAAAVGSSGLVSHSDHVHRASFLGDIQDVTLASVAQYQVLSYHVADTVTAYWRNDYVRAH